MSSHVRSSIISILQYHNEERSGSVGRVLAFGWNGCEFETHQSQCVVSLSKTLYPLVQPRKTGNCPDMTEKIVDWDVKHQHKQNQYLSFTIPQYKLNIL